MTIGAIQTAVENSKTDHQRKTGILDRSVFLGTEVGEAQKEVLKLLGYYGEAATVGAKERLAKELCDIIWNVCDLANQIGVDLGGPLATLFQKNLSRTWELDPKSPEP